MEPGLLAGFPAGSPSGPKPWRFAAWRIRKPFGLPAPAVASPEPKLGFAPAEFPRPKPPVPPGRSRAEALVPPLRSSRAETRSCPTDKGPRPAVPPVAARRLASRFCRTGVGPKPATCLMVSEPEGSETLGTERNLPLSHPLKGKPAASAWRRLRQPPGLCSATLLPGGTAGPLRSGSGWEGFRPLPVDRLGHGPEAVTKSESHQADSACG